MPFKVKKSGRKWKVTGRGGKVHGTHTTKKAAEKQATAIRGHYYGFFESMGVKPWQQFLYESREVDYVLSLLEDISMERMKVVQERLKNPEVRKAYFDLQQMWMNKMAGYDPELAAKNAGGQAGGKSGEFRELFWGMPDPKPRWELVVQSRKKIFDYLKQDANPKTLEEVASLEEKLWNLGSDLNP